MSRLRSFEIDATDYYYTKLIDSVNSSISVLKTTTNILWPYFKPSYSNLSRITTALSSTILIPLIDYFILPNFIFTEDQHSEEETLTTADRVSTFFIGSIIISSTYCAKFALNRYLIESIKKSIKIHNTQKLLDNNTKFLISNESNSTIESLQEVIIGDRVDQLAKNAVPVCIGLPSDIISIASTLARIHMITKSSTAVICTVVLSLMSALIGYQLEKLIADYGEKEAEINSTLMARTAFIESNKDFITLMQAEDFECKSIVHNLKVREKEIPKLSWVFFFCKVFDVLFIAIGGQFFDAYLPNDITKGLSPASIKNLNTILLTELTDMSSIIHICTQNYSYLKSNSTKLNIFNECYEKWINTSIHDNNMIQVFNTGKELVFKNFSVYKTPRIILADSKLESDDSVILDRTNIRLDLNKVYRLYGNSGCGKTTILKALINCWPYTDGVIEYPVKKEDICFIPQRVCIPPKSTLLEIIAYPLILEKLNNKYISEKLSLIQKVKSLLQLVNLFPEHIKENELETKGINWDSRLSGGQKQKIAIIGGLVKKPMLLIMDEATVGLDEVSKKNVYDLIKHEIITINHKSGNDSIIIYTDHNPIKGFTDGVLMVDSQQQLQLMGEESY